MPNDNTITQDHIDKLFDECKFESHTSFEKAYILSAKLPNGFVITEFAACVDPDNFDENVAIDICIKRIKSKLWELEGYKLQCKLYEEKL